MTQSFRTIPIAREASNMASKNGVDCGLGHACTFCSREETCDLDKSYHNRILIETRLADIGQIILVMANKGGVGKSTVSANLAVGLAQRGFRVGLADADIHGPNQSRFFGLVGAHTKLHDTGLEPLQFQAKGMAYPIRIGSLGFLMEDDITPIVWRDAYKHDFMHHLVGSFNWSGPEFLVVDMPPGTGNELITLCDMLEGANVAAVLVTTPQAIAQMDSLKAAQFCQDRGLPIIGAVENMAGVICPHCNGEFHIFPNDTLDTALQNMGISRIGTLPLAPELALGSDQGEPVMTSMPDSAVAAAFESIVSACVRTGEASFGVSVAHGMTEVFSQNLSDEALLQELANLPPESAALADEIKELLSAESERLRTATYNGGPD